MPTKRYKAVIFDLDGTLLNTLDDLMEAGNRALTAFDLPVHPLSSYRRMVGGGIPPLVERMLPDGGADRTRYHAVYDAFMAYYNDHASDKTAPYPGITALLAHLKAEGFTLGVLSNKDDALARPIVEHYFPGIFHSVRGMVAGVPPKPHPAALLSMLDELRLDARETLFCGDSGVDIRTGNAAGLDTCGVLWGFRDEDELLAEGANSVAADCEVLAGVLGVGWGRDEEA